MYENNDETFVKLEIVNLCCSKFDSVTSDNWRSLLMKFLQLFDCVALASRRCGEADSFLETSRF